MPHTPAALLCLLVLLPAFHATARAPVRAALQPQPLKPSCLYIPLRPDQKAAPRYRNNIHHQSEFIFPAVDRILSLARNQTVVHTLLIELTLLPWSREVLTLVRPGLRVIHFNSSTTRPLRTAELEQAVQLCGPIAGIPTSRRVRLSCSTYLSAAAFNVLRQRAQEVCGVPIPRACRNSSGFVGHRIGILNRHSGNRLVASKPPLEVALQRRYPASEVVVRTTANNATLCDQIAWFSGVDVLLVAHGQSETNSVFMPVGSTMIELLPWALPNYCTYKAALQGSGVHVGQVVARRQRRDTYAAFQGGSYNQSACNQDKSCYGHHRDLQTMVMGIGEVMSAVDAVGALNPVCSSGNARARGVPLSGQRTASRRGDGGARQRAQRRPLDRLYGTSGPRRQQDPWLVEGS